MRKFKQKAALLERRYIRTFKSCTYGLIVPWVTNHWWSLLLLEPPVLSK